VIALTDAAATERAGTALAALVRAGDAIALVGDLGAGKTTLVAALVAALGGGVATSPTFALVNEYPGGRLAVTHVDLYRVEKERELAELGLDEARDLLIVEWADRFDVMPRDHLRLELAHAGDGRRLTASGTGPRGRVLAEALARALGAS
jgi:tRNA threonylcarbamoyl adenosine modification protein YjeE